MKAGSVSCSLRKPQTLSKETSVSITPSTLYTNRSIFTWRQCMWFSGLIQQLKPDTQRLKERGRHSEDRGLEPPLTIDHDLHQLLDSRDRRCCSNKTCTGRWRQRQRGGALFTVNPQASGVCCVGVANECTSYSLPYNIMVGAVQLKVEAVIYRTLY